MQIENSSRVSPGVGGWYVMGWAGDGSSKFSSQSGDSDEPSSTLLDSLDSDSVLLKVTELVSRLSGWMLPVLSPWASKSVVGQLRALFGWRFSWLFC